MRYSRLKESEEILARAIKQFTEDDVLNSFSEALNISKDNGITKL